MTNPMFDGATLYISTVEKPRRTLPILFNWHFELITPLYGVYLDGDGRERVKFATAEQARDDALVFAKEYGFTVGKVEIETAKMYAAGRTEELNR